MLAGFEPMKASWVGQGYILGWSASFQKAVWRCNLTLKIGSGPTMILAVCSMND